MIGKRAIFLFVCVLLLSLLGNSYAQTSRGTVLGVVTDQQGGVVAGATVELTRTETNSTRSEVTNEVGIFRFDAVDLGNYDLTVKMTGFSTFVVKQIKVSANQTAAVDPVLAVATENVTVTVKGEAAEVQLNEEKRGTNITERSLAQLPISGQDSTNLILLLPGVTTNQTGVGGGVGSVNGARARSNNYMIDGVENNDISVAGPGLILTNNDALQEVAIQTSNFSAEFGRAGGAVINQIIKSGTNNPAGTLAWVYRSQRLNASTRTQRLAYVPGSGNPLKPVFKENIPAFTFGSPVVIPHIYNGKDKTFIFVAGQWDRYSDGGTQASYRVPTEAGYQVLKPLATTCANVASYLGFLGSLRGNPANSASAYSIALPASLASTSCSGGARTGQTVETAIATLFAPTVYLNNNHQIRFDHQISNKQYFMVRWLYNRTTNSPDSIGFTPDFSTLYSEKSFGVAVNHTYMISNHTTNEVRFNFQRVNLGYPLANPESVGNTLPQISLTGLSSIGVSSTYPQGRVSNSYQYQDTATTIRGTHSIRFGGDILRQLARQQAPFNYRGTASYFSTSSSTLVPGGVTSMANWIDDYAGTSSGPVSITFGSGIYYPNLFRWTLFAQDGWKVTQHLTLNYGIRYENFGQPANSFKYPAYTGNTPGAITTSTKVNPDNNNFGPSFGFAWNPDPKSGWLANKLLAKLFGKGKLVVRGGYQLTYDTWYNNLLSNMAAGSPNALANVPVPSSSTAATPRGLSNLSAVLPSLVPTAVDDLSSASSQFDANIRNPYTQRWSLGIQREILGKTVLDIAYVGSVTRKQFRTVAMNPYLPNAALNGFGSRIVSTIGARQIRASFVNGNYNSMQLGIRRRFSNTPVGGLSFDSNYTWSRNMDTGTETFATNGSPQNASISPILVERMGLSGNIDYGPSDNDRRHMWSTSLMWDIRGPKSGILGQILGGWSTASTLTFRSGVPYTVLNGFDRMYEGGADATALRPDVGNPNAPVDTRAVTVPVGAASASACPSGLRDLNVTASASNGYGCTTSDQVRWIAVTSYSVPGANTAGRNSVYTSGYSSVNLNALKTFRFTEKVRLEYRAEIFNLLNHENFDSPGSVTKTVNGTGAGLFLNFTQISGGSRTMRMGLKLLF